MFLFNFNCCAQCIILSRSYGGEGTLSNATISLSVRLSVTLSAAQTQNGAFYGSVNMSTDRKSRAAITWSVHFSQIDEILRMNPAYRTIISGSIRYSKTRCILQANLSFRGGYMLFINTLLHPG